MLNFARYLSSRQPLHDFVELIEVAVLDMRRAASVTAVIDANP